MINWHNLASRSICQISLSEMLYVGIDPLKVKHDVTNFRPLLSL